MILRSRDPEVVRQASVLTESIQDEVEKAKILFYWVRDQVKYNPYSPFWEPEHYWPATTLNRGEGYCVQKAALLAGLARAAGLPARLAFADIVNHRVSDKLMAMMGTNLFAYHGYCQLFVNGKWVRATPAFDRGLCDSQGIFPVEFDGQSDAVLHRLDREGRLHIEYVRHHGTYADVPLGELLAAWESAYSKDRVAMWKTADHARWPH